MNQLSRRQEGDELVLLNVASDEYVVLNQHAMALWNRIESGEGDIDALISAHAESLGLSPEVAGHQVLAFLDELESAGFVKTELDFTKDTAPLLDVPLTGLPAGRSAYRLTPPPRTASGRRSVMLGVQRMNMTVREIRHLAALTLDSDVSAPQRLIVTDAEPSALTLRDIERVAEREDPKGSERLNVILDLNQPNGGMSVRDLLDLGTVRAVPTPTVRRIVIIIITDDTIIIIIIRDGPGPTRGKSKSACKTMCV